MMAKLTIPEIYVHECDEVILFEDLANECLEIRLDTIIIDVFAKGGMPTIRKVTEKPE